jgi:hypothetical protein
MSFPSEISSNLSLPQFSQKQLQDQIIFCLFHNDLTSCSLFFHLCTLAKFNSSSVPCNISGQIKAKLSSLSIEPPIISYDKAHVIDSIQDISFDIKLDLIVKEFNMFGVPLGTFDLGKHIDYCGKKIQTTFAIGYNLSYKCKLLFSQTESITDEGSHFSRLTDSTSFYSLFISNSDKLSYKRVPVIIKSSESNLDIFHNLFDSQNLQDSFKLHSHYFIRQTFINEKKNTILRYLVSFDLIIPTRGISSVEVRTPVLVLTYQDIELPNSESYTTLSLGYSLNFVSEKTKLRTIYLCLFCIGNLIMIIAAISSTVFFSKRMNQISQYSNIPDKADPITPYQKRTEILFEKYFEIPMHKQVKQKGLYMVKSTFKYLVIYNAIMNLGIWFICFILLKLQNKNKLNLLSSTVFKEEYLLEKITGVTFYVCLLVYIILEIYQQSFRKIFVIDWEKHNLEEIKEQRINYDSELSYFSILKSENETNPASESFLQQTKETPRSNLNTNSVDKNRLLAESFENEPSYMELIQSDDDNVHPKPSIKRNYKEDFIQVKEKDHPINLMNMVYKNYFNSAKEILSDDVILSKAKDFPLFVQSKMNNHNDVDSNLTKTSAWRKIMITNSLNEVSNQISVSPLIILCVSYCILEGLKMLDLGYSNRKGQMVDDFSETHYFLRKYLILGVIIVVSLLVWILRFFFRVVRGYASSELLDLCSVCNISLMVQLESGSFCYVHGKNHSGSGEGDLQSIYSKLVMEGTAFQATRGLSPKSDHQIFEVLVGSLLFDKVNEIRQQAAKYLEFVENNLELIKDVSKKKEVVLKHSRNEIDLKIFKLINEEVENTLKESICTSNFTCKIKELSEKFFTYEGLELLANLNNNVDKKINTFKSRVVGVPFNIKIMKKRILSRIRNQ